MGFADGEADAVAAAKDGKNDEVSVTFGNNSAELTIVDSNSKRYALVLKDLEKEIIPGESKHRISAGKKVTLKLKKRRPGTWTRLLKPKLLPTFDIGCFTQCMFIRIDFLRSASR